MPGYRRAPADEKFTKAHNTTTRKNRTKDRKMDLDSGSSGGEWEDDVPLAILRELQGMGDEFDHSMGESDGGSDSGSDGGDPPDLPTILHEGERRWVRVPQGTTKPNAMKRFEEETGITDEVDLTTTKSVFDFLHIPQL